MGMVARTEETVARPEDRAGAGLWAPGTDPVSQASLWVPERLYGWQTRVMRDCMKPGQREAVVTPNESGKTSCVIPVLGLSWMAAFPGSQVVSTSGVERQIHQQLWPVLKASLRKRPKWKITEELKIHAPSTDGIPGSEWTAFTSKEPSFAEGFHPRKYKDENGKVVYAPLLIIVDEAKSFNDPEMMFAFVNRCDPDCLLLISTPGEDVGPFFDAFHKERGDPWNCVEVTWDDCPHLKEGFKLQKRLDAIRKFGETDPLVLSWVFGKFYRRGGRFVFDDMEAIEACMGAARIPWVKGSRAAAIDFSGGGDEQVWGVREGNKIHPLEVFHEKNDVVLCDMLIERFQRWHLNPSEISGDAGGAGKPCIDLLESKGWGGINRYLFNATARDDLLFKFRAAEDHFAVRERVRHRSLILPKDEILKDQMRKRKYLVLNDDQRKQLEPKEKLRDRGEESPGRLDVLAMLCADMEELPSAVGRKMNELERRASMSVCGDPRDCVGGPESSGAAAVWAGGGLFD